MDRVDGDDCNVKEAGECGTTNTVQFGDGSFGHKVVPSDLENEASITTDWRRSRE